MATDATPPAAPVAPEPSPSALLEVLRGALFGAVAMAVLQAAAPWPTDNDSFYHLRMARELTTDGFARQFPWLQWTIFRDDFVSHHYGFHVLLFPFVWLSDKLTGDLILGGKMAAVVCMAATCAAYAMILRMLAAPRRGLWLLLLACVPWEFWLRMTYFRAPIAALPLMLLAIPLALRGRILAVGILAVIFTHLYGGAVIFPLAPIGILAGVIAARILERRRTTRAGAADGPATPSLTDDSVGAPSIRVAMALIAAGALGIVLGLATSPYFPGNFHFLYTQIFQTGLAATPEVGNEWLPHNPLYLASISIGLAAVWAYALARRARLRMPLDRRTLALLGINLVYLALMLKARRFIEYWPVFSLISAAAWMGGDQPGRSLLSDLARIRPRLHYFVRELLLPTVIATAAASTLQYTRTSSRLTMNVPAIRDAVQYVAAHSNPGDMILTDDWDTFPVCYYYNRFNHYAVGLDPVFTSSKFPDVWERYKRITRGETPYALPANLRGTGRADATLFDIRDVFGARYVMVLDDHGPLYRKLSDSPTMFKRVFATQEQEGKPPAASIFEVIK